MASDCDLYGFTHSIIYLGNVNKSPHSWKNKLKSSKTDKIYLSLFKYTFGKYHIPEFLNQEIVNYYDSYHKNKQRTLIGSMNIKAIDWVICIGMGGSLYKEHTKSLLSRKETANFIKYGRKELSLYQNIWFARAITLGCNFGFAMNIARVLNRNIADEFHLSIMRFFINNPIEQNEMETLFDCFKGLHDDNPFFNLKKRTLEAVRVLSKEWHRIQIKRKKYSDLFWTGHPIDNWTYEVHDKDNNVWTMTQILKTNDLIAEGHAMRHCVGSYSNACKSGQSSIWSLKRQNKYDSKMRRSLTIQVVDDGQHFSVSQIRGYANRLPTHEEKNIVQRWLNENGIHSSRGYY